MFFLLGVALSAQGRFPSLFHRIECRWCHACAPVKQLTYNFRTTIVSSRRQRRAEGGNSQIDVRTMLEEQIHYVSMSQSCCPHQRSSAPLMMVRLGSGCQEHFHEVDPTVGRGKSQRYRFPDLSDGLVRVSPLGQQQFNHT